MCGFGPSRRAMARLQRSITLGAYSARRQMLKNVQSVVDIGCSQMQQQGSDPICSRIQDPIEVLLREILKSGEHRAAHPVDGRSCTVPVSRKLSG